MVRSFLIAALLFSSMAYADLFDFGTEKGKESRLPAFVEKLKNLEMKDGPQFEDQFNQLVKRIENAVEDEKLYCSGETTNNEGKTLPPAQKQLCMRELKKQYLEATNTIFEVKKKYLGFIHQRQVEKLSEIQSKLKTDIEKNF